MTTNDIHDSLVICTELLSVPDGVPVEEFIENVLKVKTRLDEILNHWDYAHEAIGGK